VKLSGILKNVFKFWGAFTLGGLFIGGLITFGIWFTLEIQHQPPDEGNSLPWEALSNDTAIVPHKGMMAVERPQNGEADTIVFYMRKNELSNCDERCRWRNRLIYDPFVRKIIFVGSLDLNNDDINEVIVLDYGHHGYIPDLNSRLIFWKKPKDDKPVISQPLFRGHTVHVQGQTLIFTPLFNLEPETHCKFRNVKLLCKKTNIIKWKALSQDPNEKKALVGF
jgi:hypothetical protein